MQSLFILTCVFLCVICFFCSRRSVNRIVVDQFSGYMMRSLPALLCNCMFDSDSFRHFDPTTDSYLYRTTVTNCIDVVVSFLTHFHPEWILTARSHLIFSALVSVLLNKNPCPNTMFSLRFEAGLCGSCL